MPAFGRGTLAAALATAMVVTPSLAPAQEKIMGKPVNDAAITKTERKSDVLQLAEDYSRANPVVAIAIFKGQKDAITGEKIGDTLSAILKKNYQGTPSKYFVEPGGDYTAIALVVDGHFYGPYGLKESLSGVALAADNYWSKVQRGKFPPPSSATTASIPGGIAAKPEPGQQ